jgi:DNA adenine methylase
MTNTLFLAPTKTPLVSDAPSILKWAGSKRVLAPTLVPWIRENLSAEGRYFEPFCGSAAVFLRLRAEGFAGPAILADRLSPLVESYATLKSAEGPKKVRQVLELLEKTGPFKKSYEAVRGMMNRHLAGDRMLPNAAAACFLYLNHRGFNGLWRTNRDGQMNTPWGGERTTPLPSLDQLEAFSLVLANTKLRCSDFEEVIAEAKFGDVVFADPPYAGCFTGYSGIFNEDDQVRLRNALLAAWERGAAIVATNSDAPLVEALYGQHPFELQKLEVRYSIGGKASSRKTRLETLILAGAQ